MRASLLTCTGSRPTNAGARPSPVAAGIVPTPTRASEAAQRRRKACGYTAHLRPGLSAVSLPKGAFVFVYGQGLRVQRVQLALLTHRADIQTDAAHTVDSDVGDKAL